MSLITIAWSFVAAIGLTFVFFQLALWRGQSDNFTPLLAAIMAFAASIGALCELVMAKSPSISTYETALLINNLSIFLLLVPMVWFIRLRLGTGPKWLAWTITAIWVFCLMVNFIMPGNLTFSSIEHLEEQTSFWGEPFVVPVGTANPLRFLSEIASLLLIIFVSWAIVAAIFIGRGRRALRLGGAVLFFIVTAAIHTVLVDVGSVKTPYMISWAFMAIAVALGSEFIHEVASAARLSTEMKRGEARWQALIEHVDLGVIGLTAEGSISFANPAMLSLLGRNYRSILGQPLFDFVPSALREELRMRISTAREFGPRPRTNYPLVDAQGNRHEVVWSVVPIRKEAGVITGFMAICDDITTAHQMELDLRESRLAIEKLDRSAALSEITAGIAHELNQPLAAILSNAQAGKHLLGRDPIPTEELSEILNDIVDDDKRAKEVILGIRNLLSPQQGSMAATDFVDVTDDIRRFLASDLMARGVDLTIVHEQKQQLIECNKVQIEQVLLNLILNAVKAQSESGSLDPKIEIVTKARRNYLSVFVCDSGPGIDPKVHQSILQPGVTTRQDGLGMGLTISRRIIENHRGKLAFKSLLGEGTIFRFTLPLAASAVKKE
jgi:PAS domain S-box-containing protein